MLIDTLNPGEGVLFLSKNIMNVHEYILSHIDNTIRIPGKDDKNSFFKIPKPYTVPCENEGFVNFFYWDTYFTNFIFLINNRLEQAQNNLDVMAFFIDKLGYVPNADHLIFRSQPPVFIRGVYDLYQKCQSKDIIFRYLNQMIREMDFFETERNNELGLNNYSCHELKPGLELYYEEFDRRLGSYSEQEKKIDKYELTKDLLAIAESGWDFNVRFKTENNRFAALKFAHVDLSSLIYDALIKLGEMLEIINDPRATIFYKKAQEKKEAITKYLKDTSDGIYKDYNYIDKSFSQTISVASFYPYAFNIEKDKESAIKLFNLLDYKYGLSVTPYRGENETYFQWDYPSVWPTNVYFAYIALKNVGATKEAHILKTKYLDLVDSVFQKTGKLWEKYDAIKGTVAVTNEYDTPSMLGWTAGVYEFLLQED